MRRPQAGTVALIVTALLAILFVWFVATRP
jgi:hypothetical protein